MKQFSLEEYLKNRREVVTRDGRKARILCCDLKNDPYTVVAAITDGDMEVPITYSKRGKAILGRESNSDLFFAQEKHEGWVNVYPGPITGVVVYKSKEDAKYGANADAKVIATIKIEWEE